MKEYVCSYDGILFKQDLQELKKTRLLTILDFELPFGEPFIFNGKTYSPRMRSPKENITCVKEFTFDGDGEESYGDDTLMCPYCGDEVGDAWELGDSGEQECSTCYSTFSFEREVNPCYSVNPVKRRELKEIQELKVKGLNDR